MSAEFFNAPAVRAELANIFTLHEDMVRLLNPAVMQNLTAEKQNERIEKVIELIERQKIFYTRLTLESYDDVELQEVRHKIDGIGQRFGFQGTFSQHADTMIQRLKKRLTPPK